MSDLDNKIEDIKTTLYSLKVVKEYFSLANIIQNSEELQSILKNKKYFQQLNVQEPNNVFYKSEYDKSLKEYKDNPIIQNYLSTKTEVIEIVNFLKEELSL